MKKSLIIAFILVLSAFSYIGCADPEQGGLVILEGPTMVSINSEGKLEFNGALVNTGVDPVNSIYVVIVIKDEGGNVIEINSTQISENEFDILYPAESTFFSITVNSDSADVYSKEVEIYYDSEF